jgi:hypothetical protein
MVKINALHVHLVTIFFQTMQLDVVKLEKHGVLWQVFIVFLALLH